MDHFQCALRGINSLSSNNNCVIISWKMSTSPIQVGQKFKELFTGNTMDEQHMVGRKFRYDLDSAASKSPSTMNRLKACSLDSLVFDDLIVNRKFETVSRLKQKRASCCLSFLKLIVAMLIFTVVLISIIASKLSLVSIGQQLTANNLSLHYNNYSFNCYPLTHNMTEISYGNICNSESALVALMIILVVPQLFAFVFAMCLSGMRKQHPWPSVKAMLLGLTISTLEVVALSSFAVLVLSRVPSPGLTISLMNGLLIIPVFYQLLRGLMQSTNPNQAIVGQRRPRNKTCHNLRDIVFSAAGLLLQIAGISGIVYYAALENGYEALFLPFSIILLSLSWCPKLREVQIDQTRKRVEKREAEISGHVNKGFEGSPKITSQSSSRMSTSSIRDQLSDDSRRVIVETSSARGKATIIYAGYKIILIPFCVIVISKAFDVIDVSKIDLGFIHLYHNNTILLSLIVQLVTSFLGYLACWMACTINLQRLCFALPLTLATPLSIMLVTSEYCDELGIGYCSSFNGGDWKYILLLGVGIWLGQFFATTYYVWKAQDFVMAKESMMFWLPGYEGMFLEQSMLLNRKNEITNEYSINYLNLIKKSSIYICTTMYHEADFEMEQLMQSVAGVDRARKNAGQKIEMHVFFDDGVRDTVPKKYALQLISLIDNSLGIKLEDSIKLETPYGLQMKWLLPGGMNFVVHFKDNFKVKNKKRWSQVMYMSYVMDFKESGNHDNAYIVTTDADVRFTPEDIMSLMDYMSRDPTVGAVCGRTHPMGNGPLVWYQIFDYAMGHWLLKVAEDVMGSVLCCPGCFSMYRVRALADVLPIYSSNVECAMDFLTKDMGEDRWLCTLLIENGWRLQYCASAENSTYCPTDFNEFYTQRRRWNPSSVANGLLLIQEALKIRSENDTVTIGFITYEVLIMLSSILGPSNVILIVAGAMSYAFPASVNPITVLVLMLMVSTAFTLICIYTQQSTQLLCAKALTLVFAFIMTITFVGLLSQVSDELIGLSNGGNQTSTLSLSSCSSTSAASSTSLSISPATIFLLYLITILLITALLHGTEGFSLIHGIWYMLCLPSGYLLLTIFSLANITDRSWGTREDVTEKPSPKGPWYKTALESILKLRKEKRSRKSFAVGQNHHEKRLERTLRDGHEATPYKSSPSRITNFVKKLLSTPTKSFDRDATNENRPRRLSSNGGTETDHQILVIEHPITEEKDWIQHEYPEDMMSEASYDYSDEFEFSGDLKDHRNDNALYIADWLVGRYKQYLDLFIEHGYDDTSFLPGLQEQELIDIGIKNRGHRKKLLHEIEKLPEKEIEQHVPDDVRVWLINLGLDQYWESFRDNSYNEANALADLKFMDKGTISQTFNIYKGGHLKKLAKGIKHLQYPSTTQKRIAQARRNIELTPLLSLEFNNNDGGREFRFWHRLRAATLMPEQAAFGQSLELKSKLVELRNNALIFVAIANLLWITVVMVMISQECKLQVLNINVLSLLFIGMYGIVYLLQFITLICHRFSTWVHMLARVPFVPGRKYMHEWFINDEDISKPILTSNDRGYENQVLNKPNGLEQGLRDSFKQKPLNSGFFKGGLLLPDRSSSSKRKRSDIFSPTFEPFDSEPVYINDFSAQRNSKYLSHYVYESEPEIVLRKSEKFKNKRSRSLVNLTGDAFCKNTVDSDKFSLSGFVTREIQPLNDVTEEINNQIEKEMPLNTQQYAVVMDTENHIIPTQIEE